MLDLQTPGISTAVTCVGWGEKVLSCCAARLGVVAGCRTGFVARFSVFCTLLCFCRLVYFSPCHGFGRG